MSEMTQTFPVKGMHCNGCANLVRSILEEDVQGVKKADVNLEREEVALTYDQDSTTLNDAAKTMKDNGYTLEIPPAG